MKALRPIPTAHPVIVIASILLISAMLMWSYLTDLQGPPQWVTMVVVSIVMAGSVISRQRHVRDLKRDPDSTSRF